MMDKDRKQLECLRMSLYRAAQVAKIRPEIGQRELEDLCEKDTGWNTLVAELTNEIETLQANEHSPRAWLDELEGLVFEEQHGTLTKHQQSRYVELVDMLQGSNTEIPFGIEI